MISIGMKIIEPPKKAIESVKKVAEKTGDIMKLSGTDIQVIALAFHLKGILLTDDYAMQNVAKEMGIEYRNVIEEGIKNKFYWKYRCKSCRRFFHELQKECPVCGGEIKRVK